MRFLLDANLSPESAQFLRTHGHKVQSIQEDRLTYLTDEEVVRLAKSRRRIIITHDLDFGEIYHFIEKEKVGIIVLRLKDQTVESVNRVIHAFLLSPLAKRHNLYHSLVIVEEAIVRLYKP